MDRFPDPEAIRINLSEGDWIEIKKFLTIGERHKAFAAATKPAFMGERFELNPERAFIANVAAYLLDWSFTRGGVKVPIRGMPFEIVLDTLQNLPADAFAEVREAIEQHEAALEQEKKLRAGVSVL